MLPSAAKVVWLPHKRLSMIQSIKRSQKKSSIRPLSLDRKKQKKKKKKKLRAFSTVDQVDLLASLLRVCSRWLLSGVY